MDLIYLGGERPRILTLGRCRDLRWGSLAPNPADRAEPPWPRTPEIQVRDVAQPREFLVEVEGDRLGPIWLLMATTGMRRGELMGLPWADIDLDAGRVSIVQTHAIVSRKIVVSEPKTLMGRRSIALDGATVGASPPVPPAPRRGASGARGTWTETGLVVVHEDVTPINPRSLSSAFAGHLDAVEH